MSFPSSVAVISTYGRFQARAIFLGRRVFRNRGLATPSVSRTQYRLDRVRARALIANSAN